MQNTQSLCIHVLLLIIGGLTQCLALKNISVVQGGTVTLTCRLKNTKIRDPVELRNPEGFALFFNKDKGLRDNRTKLVTLTDSKFSVRVTDIKFKDGGVYKCLRYNNLLSVKKYKVIVIGAPKVEMYKQDDKTMLKCSASANEHPPILSWLMDNGLEIAAHPNYEIKNKSNKYTAVSQLSVKVPRKRVTVKCLVRHSALYGAKLETFIHLGNQNQDASTLSIKLGSTDTTVMSTTVMSTLFTSTSFTNSHSELETTNYNNTTAVNKTTEGTLNGSTTILGNTTANETTELISLTTEGTPSNTSIQISSNTTGNDDTCFETRIKRGNSVLLVLLVTCLIICLVVVLAFFLVSLRKAHIAWRKENEESDQSVESSKSKSSNEERQKQQQRERGFWNTSFTKYKAEETLEAQATPASVQVINENSQHCISTIKETEL